MSIGLDKEAGLKAWFEMFWSNASVLEISRQHACSKSRVQRRHGNCESVC